MNSEDKDVSKQMLMSVTGLGAKRKMLLSPLNGRTQYLDKPTHDGRRPTSLGEGQ